jgi:cell wall-associated NlpC family hydrolase
MPAPVLVAAGQVARTVVLRRLARIAVVALPVVLVGGLAMGILALLLATSGDETAGDAVPGGGCSTITTATVTQASQAQPPGPAGLSPQQIANAQTIVAVGRQLNVPAYGWVIAVATALQESSLTNLTHGHLDSLGLFQQRAAWGPDTARLDPQTAARMFYAGGQHGQPGLLQVPGFASLPLTVAAQAVQHSAFPDAYARWEPLARQVVADPTVLSATCYTTADYRGDGTPGANAVAAALRYLGTPYSWGGGGIGGPGVGFGPGGATLGFDCSSLVQYAYHQATGLTLPRTTDAQAAALPHLPPGTPLRAGDLLFFHSPDDPPGNYHHVGIYDGQGGMVHAPRTGKTVEVIHNVLTDPYFRSQLALVARPVLASSQVIAAGTGG